MSNNKIPLNIMAFPAGPICNLHCKYCYYYNKTGLYPEVNNFQMSEEVLEEYIKQYIELQPDPYIAFGWQGGEPTLRGLPFFKKAVSLQKKYLPTDWQCQNSFQTNGTLLTKEWCKFFKENNFLIGISIDGPRELHDSYRTDKEGNPSFNSVMKGLNLLKTFDIDYNILCTVNNINAKYPLKVYHFFKEQKINFIQFIPIVECINEKISIQSVDSRSFSRFLITIFDKWILNDYGEIFIQIFEECVSAWLGFGTTLCTFKKTCGAAPVMEYNGDLYTCDHFVFPEYKLGNILETSIIELANSPILYEFGHSKLTDLPNICLQCKYCFICNGGCLRTRTVDTGNGKKINYLCSGYYQFFNYIDLYMRNIAKNMKLKKPHCLLRKN